MKSFKLFQLFGMVIIIGLITTSSWMMMNMPRAQAKPITIVKPYLKDPIHFDEFNMLFQEDVDYLEDHGFIKGTLLPSGIIYQ
jgi:hypothetical protein